MKRNLSLGVVVLLALAGLVFWKCHGGSGSSSHTTAASKTVAGPAHVAAPRKDPRTLERSSIAGTITDEDKHPIARARICADAHTKALSSQLLRDPLCTTANDQGQYELRDLFAATYTVSAMAKPFRPGRYFVDAAHNDTSFELAAGEHKTGVDITLRKGGVEITGVVADVTGGPVAHAQVRARGSRWDHDSGESPSAETDEQGKFSLWVKPGNTTVSAIADGYTSGSDSGRAPGKFEILLTPESSLSGTVVDVKTNAPVAGVEVSVNELEWSGGSWSSRESSDLTDDQGKFRISRLRPNRYSIEASSPTGTGRSEGSTLVGLGQHVDGVIVKLHGAIQISGRIVRPDKTPCKDGWVSFRDPKSERSASASTDPDGTVRANGVLPGTYQVWVSCPGFQSLDKYDEIAVTDKDVADLEWAVVAGSIIRGRVLTKSGTPVEDAKVWARTTGGAARAKTAWSNGTSKKDGTYELEGLRAATYSIECSTDAGIGPKEGWKVSVGEATTKDQDLVLDDFGSIQGTVVDADGKPVASVRVLAMSLSGGRGFRDEMRSSDDGTFKVDGLRAGDYRVLAFRGWGEDLRKPGTNDDAKQGEKATVRVGQVAQIKLVVEALSGIIKGSVVDADGKPVSDAFVSAARESDAAGANRSSVSETRWSWDEKPVVTSTEGTFALTKLSPGKYTIRAFRKGGGEAVSEHVAIGSTAKLQIKPTGTLEGVVRVRGGKAPEELSVSLTDRKTGFDRSEHFFRTDGRYAIRDLPAGHFLLTASAEAGKKQLEVDLAEAEAKTGVDIELDPLVTLTGRVVELGTDKPVAGIKMTASIGKTNGGFSFSFGADQDQSDVSDDTGHFTIKNAPIGVVTLRGFPKDFASSDWGWIQAVRTVDGKTGTIDIGDVRAIKRRVKRGDPAGDMGMHFVQVPEDTPVDQVTYKISWIDPQGPAAKLDIKVGDQIVSVDGTSILGEYSAYAWLLMRAPPGTKLMLGLARGVIVPLVLAAP